MTDHDACPTCGAAQIDVTADDLDPNLMLDWITITRKLTDAGPEIGLESSDNIAFYDAMAMVHIAADTIAQGGLNNDGDDND